MSSGSGVGAIIALVVGLTAAWLIGKWWDKKLTPWFAARSKQQEERRAAKRQEIEAWDEDTIAAERKAKERAAEIRVKKSVKG